MMTETCPLPARWRQRAEKLMETAAAQGATPDRARAEQIGDELRAFEVFLATIEGSSTRPETTPAAGPVTGAS